jgi:excisionase family DNA binding protein
MLGYGGHFSTKSRRHSTTLTALRQARAEHRALEQRGGLGLGDRATVTVGQWRYVGRGYSPEAALIATSAREGRSTMADRLLSVQQAAERLGTSVRFPRRLIAERRITFVRVGRHVRIPEAALDDFISRNTTRPISRRIGRAVA